MVPVGAVIEGGKDSTTGVIDSSVKGVATVSTAVLEDVSDITATAAKVPSGVIETGQVKKSIIKPRITR